MRREDERLTQDFKFSLDFAGNLFVGSVPVSSYSSPHGANDPRRTDSLKVHWEGLEITKVIAKVHGEEREFTGYEARAFKTMTLSLFGDQFKAKLTQLIESEDL